MKARQIDGSGGKTFAVIFDKGDGFPSGLLEFARRQRLESAEFTAVGAFSDVTLGYFDRQRMEYKKIPVQEQVEVLSLVGNIAQSEGQPKVHAHVVLGTSDGTTRGGHVLDAHVWPTLEVMLSESTAALRRETDAETGLALIKL